MNKTKSYTSFRAEMKGRDGKWRGYFGTPPRDIPASEATGDPVLLQRCIDERWDKESRFQWRIFEAHTTVTEILYDPDKPRKCGKKNCSTKCWKCDWKSYSQKVPCQEEA